MQLSTAIPIVIAAMVMVIRSRGIPSKPMTPSIAKQAIIFGAIVMAAIFKDLKRIRSIINMPVITMARDFICESNKLCSILL